jgi:DNA-binding MarR family transcriptional regulator
MEAFEMMWKLGGAWRRIAGAMLRPYRISLSQYELTWLTRRWGAINPSIAASELGWDRPTLTVVAAACLKAGWLKRKPSSRDRRSSTLELTGAGEELLDRIEAAKPFAAERLGDPLDVVGPDERIELARLLDRVWRRAQDLWGRFPERRR